MMLECRSAIYNRTVRTVRARGYSLIEAIIATAVLCALLFVVGDAVTHTLRAASLSGGRAGSARTVSELAIRMSEEARSSAAVFIPATDVFGNPNGGTSAHEVDFFRRLSAGGDTYVAYRFDAAGGSVTRYEYAPASAGAAIVHADQAAENIAAFSPVRVTAGSMSDVLDPATVNTGVSVRDDHLRSADFFDINHYPEIVFQSTAISQTAKDDYAVIGTLSMRGVERPVTLYARAAGDGIDPFGSRRAGVSARTTLNRKDFGLQWNRALESGGLLVGDEVEINLEIEAVLDQVARDAAA